MCTESTDSFLTDLAASASGGRMGIVLPIDMGNDKSAWQKVKNYFNSSRMKAFEVGVGKPGTDLNFGYGVEANKDKTITGLIRSISK